MTKTKGVPASGIEWICDANPGFMLDMSSTVFRYAISKLPKKDQDGLYLALDMFENDFERAVRKAIAPARRGSKKTSLRSRSM